MTNSWGDTQKQVAKSLFGRPLRVALCAWILDREGEPFYLREAQRAMEQQYEEAGSGVRTELELFLAHGMLSKYEDGRRHYYLAAESPFWQAFQSIARAVGLRPAPAPGCEAGYESRRRRSRVDPAWETLSYEDGGGANGPLGAHAGDAVTDV